MNSVLKLVERSMTLEKRIVRYQPTPVNVHEAHDQVGYMMQAMWKFARSVGVDPGPLPTLFIVSSETSAFQLRALTSVTIEVLAAYHVWGLSRSADEALRKVLDLSSDRVNFQKIIDEDAERSDEEQSEILD